MSEALHTVALSTLAEITMGQSPESAIVSETERGLPFLQGCAEFGERHPSTRLWCSPPLRVAKKGSVLVSVRAPVGTTNLADQDYCIGRGLGAVRAKDGVSNGVFLLNAIEHNVGFLHQRSQGSTFSAIGSRELASFPVPDLTSDQQRRIAEILGTVDEVIEQTEALIAKQQQVKAGLMHDLFTRGVTATGQLRPPPAEAPHLYHDSPLGPIPKEWALMKCSEICDKITVGIVVRPTQYYVNEGVPAFRSANVRETGIDPTDFVFISREANELLAKSQLKAGDVVSVRTGYPGTTAVVPPEFEGANCIDILISRPTSQIDPHFMAAWINSSFGKDQVLKKQGGLAQQHFNVGDLRNLLFVVPDKQEQTAIIARLLAINQRIQAETAHLAKLRQQKQGLMHDLLTARVPV